ncbi:MAG: hypothetical protein U0841_30770 [Chloroflexia bacterium]
MRNGATANGGDSGQLGGVGGDETARYGLLYLAVLWGVSPRSAWKSPPWRLIAPYFGNSTLIWATIIGLTLTLPLGRLLPQRQVGRPF